MAKTGVELFCAKVNGKYIDTDGYPRTNKYQCWDLFDYFCRMYSMPLSRHCSLTGYAPDIFKLAKERGYEKYFEIVLPNELTYGDWCFWDGYGRRHVALLVDTGKYLTQNPGATTIKPIPAQGLIGGLRPTFINGWRIADEVPTGTNVDIEAEAWKVIRGQYGNGANRKNKLVSLYGESIYKQIQRKVNELIK